MFKKLTLVLILALSTALPSYAQSMNWVNVASSNDGTKLDVDTNSIHRSGSLVGYSIRMRYPRPDKIGAVIGGIQEIADCNSGVFQVQESIAFNRQNMIVFNQKYNNAPVQQVESGTLGHAKYNFVCQAQMHRDAVQDFVDISRAATEAVDTVGRARFIDP
ncbi:surface-adhesin E family protein [Nostoc sp.]|uniref:surface-adhesin E family protein n=1 Tax=Nostoc sp. TaxID=1180 RepID=UPI002FFA28D0